MNPGPIRLAIISDTNCEVLAHYFQNLPGNSKIDVTTSPYGQTLEILLNPSHSFWSIHFDCALVMTQPELVSETLSKYNYQVTFNQDNLRQEVVKFASVILAIKKRVPTIIVTSWVLPFWKYNSFLTDYKKEGLQNSLLTMNYCLMKELENINGCYLINPLKWIDSSTGPTFSAKLWYVTKQSFSNCFFKNLALEICSSIGCLYGKSRKVIILDLDDTIWGGVVGDVGWNNLRLGGHDSVGEAYVDFQIALKRLKNSGILLVISSKNDEEVALNAIRNHPEMILKLEDFAAWKINWEDKSDNIKQLLKELNLGAQSAVFIDNSPVERNRVQVALPEILVPNWPEDPTDYLKALTGLSCFDKSFVTDEDLHRTEMINHENYRASLKKNAASFEHWLKSLQIKCFVEPLSSSNLNRVVQLMNKTNQMNLKTRRITSEELLAWCSQRDNLLYAVRVRDKFGDYGLTGIIGITKSKNKVVIEDYILSCRVLGRKIEETMLGMVCFLSRQLDCKEVEAQYLKTDKNHPCYQFFKTSGFKENSEDGLFVWDSIKDFPMPSQVELEWKH